MVVVVGLPLRVTSLLLSDSSGGPDWKRKSGRLSAALPLLELFGEEEEYLPEWSSSPLREAIGFVVAVLMAGVAE